METDEGMLILSILFGLSFGILILYVTNLYAIFLVLLILGGTVLVATREDLRGIGRNKSLILLMALIAVFVVSASLSVPTQYVTSLFDILVGVAFLVLIMYVVKSRLFSKGSTNSGISR